MNNLEKVPLRIRLINVYALLFILLGAVLIGSVVFLKSLEFLLHTSISDSDKLFQALENQPLAQQYLFIAQALTALVSFILVPLLVIFFVWPDLQLIFTTHFHRFGELLLLAVLITIVSVPIIACLSEFNRDILHLPAQYQGVEDWMKSSEAEAEKLTNLLVYFSNYKQLMWGLLVIAILPALGEELLFRGVIQTQLTKALLNPHLAILITGFLFSFIHFQFFGFIPRMFLGVIFGYLFYWSGSIWVPVCMHFTNNALSYFAMNFYKQQKIQVDLESTKDLSPLLIAISGILFIFLLFRFYKLNRRTSIL